MLEILYLLVAAAQPASLAPPPVRAAPRASLAAYFSRDDYPASARAGSEEGHVAFQLLIGSDGRVTGCTVLGSSVSSSLDSTTCRIMRSRARFTPALNASGRPVPDSVGSSITWRLPRSVPSSSP